MGFKYMYAYFESKYEEFHQVTPPPGEPAAVGYPVLNFPTVAQVKAAFADYHLTLPKPDPEDIVQQYSFEEALDESAEILFKTSAGTTSELQTMNPLEENLMNVYTEFFANWLDFPFSLSFFQEVVPKLAIMDKSGILLSAICCCGAVHAHKIDFRYPADLPMRYYYRTLKMLQKEFESKDKCLYKCLIVSVLLSQFETFTESTKHSSSSIALLREIMNTYKVDANSSQPSAPFDSVITRSCFWLVVFTDLFYSILHKSPTLWDPSEWGVIAEVDTTSPRKYYKAWFYCRVFYLLALVNNFVNQQTVLTYEDYKEDKDGNTYKSLVKKLNDWSDKLPYSISPPTFTRYRPEVRFFWFSLTFDRITSYISTMGYHTAHILLDKKKPGLTKENCALTTNDQVRHARQIIGLLEICGNVSIWSCTLWAFHTAFPCLRTQVEILRVNVTMMFIKAWTDNAIRRTILHHYQ